MKTHFFSILFIMASLFSFGQSQYKYVIIPTRIPSVANGINPYGIGSAVYKNLREKNIRAIYEAEERPSDYCDAVTVNIEKIKTMLRNKLLIKLVDCQQHVVWSCEGSGKSKEFSVGFAEAVADAMSGLKELPENTTRQYQSVPVAYTPTSVAAPDKQHEIPVAEQVVNADPTSAPVADASDEEIYKPANLFYNYTYFIDLVDTEQGGKKLVLINGEQLGYKKLQTIALLSPSGLGDVYTIKWINANASVISGVANLAEGKLKISIQTGSVPTVITLKSYK